MLTTVVLILAGLGAGALNAIAGGGTFLSLPALVWAGVPPSWRMRPRRSPRSLDISEARGPFATTSRDRDNPD